jgi:hypothetical protein
MLATMKRNLIEMDAVPASTGAKSVRSKKKTTDD